jgi:hypothetical protein
MVGVYVAARVGVPLGTGVVDGTGVGVIVCDRYGLACIVAEMGNTGDCLPHPVTENSSSMVNANTRGNDIHLIKDIGFVLIW